MAGYTKGPWVAMKDPEEPDAPESVVMMGDFYIAACYAIGTVGDSGVLPEENAASNACLIAAAPDMYEALVGLIDKDGALVTSESALIQAMLAISKAEGE